MEKYRGGFLEEQWCPAFREPSKPTDGMDRRRSEKLNQRRLGSGRFCQTVHGRATVVKGLGVARHRR